MEGKWNKKGLESVNCSSVIVLYVKCRCKHDVKAMKAWNFFLHHQHPFALLLFFSLKLEEMHYHKKLKEVKLNFIILLSLSQTFSILMSSSSFVGDRDEREKIKTIIYIFNEWRMNHGILHNKSVKKIGKWQTVNLFSKWKLNYKETKGALKYIFIV